MLVKLFFTFLILNLVQNALTESNFYENTEELRFVKGEKTIDDTEQLICLDGLDQPKFCKEYAPEEVVCRNPNHGKKATDFMCEANFKHAEIKFKNAEIFCTESNGNTAYKIGSCHIEISLQRVTKPDVGKDGEDESWFKKNMGYVIGGSIAAVLLVVVGASAYTTFRKRRS